jgi:hypothetical protein
MNEIIKKAFGMRIIKASMPILSIVSEYPAFTKIT